jgi:hypothetical protein
MRRVMRVAIGLALVMATPVLRAEEPAPPPQVVVTPPAEAARPIVMATANAGPGATLLSGGLMTLSLSYGAAVSLAATSPHKGDARLYVPVIGPWLDLGGRGECLVPAGACGGEAIDKVFLVVDGLFQGAGAVAVVSGLLVPSLRSFDTDTRIHVFPVSFGPATPGVTAYGNF